MIAKTLSLVSTVDSVNDMAVRISAPVTTANHVASMLSLSRIGTVFVRRYGFFIYERKKMAADDETIEETDTAERDDLDESEAHRAGEFDDLRDMLNRVLDTVNKISERVNGIYDNFTDSIAQMVENGATVRENDTDAAETISRAVAGTIAQAASEDLENLDYTL